MAAMKQRNAHKNIRTRSIVLNLMVATVLAITASVEGAVLRVPAEYATISNAVSFCAQGDTVTVADGWYRDHVAIGISGITLTSDSGAVVTVDAEGSGSPVTVSAGGVTVNGLRLTGSGSNGNGIICNGANAVVMNCIAHHNGGDGFELNGTGSLYNSNAYRNATGARFSGAGTCLNTISTFNTTNFILVPGTVHRNNYSHNGMTADQGYSNTTGTDPLYNSLDSTSAVFLILSPSSECVNAGEALSGIVDRDIRGRYRPLAGVWDAGAHETRYGGIWLHHFDVTCTPADTTIREPITVSVTAVTQNASVYSSYSVDTRFTVTGATAGDSLVFAGITCNGDGNGTVPGSAFVNGTAVFEVRYPVAFDSVLIRVSDPEDSSGTSGSVMWTVPSVYDSLVGGIPDYLSIDAVPGTVIAGVPVTDISISAYKDTAGMAGPYVPVRFDADNHPGILTVWQVGGFTVSAYGYRCASPSAVQNYPLDRSNMNGGMLFTNASPHRIRVCLVDTAANDTLVRSDWSDGIVVIPGEAVNIEIRDRNYDPYSWLDSMHMSTDDQISLYSGFYDSLGNYIGNATAQWNSDSTFKPIVSALESSIVHRFPMVAHGYVYAGSEGLRSDSVFVEISSGRAIRYVTEVVVDPVMSPGGVTATSVGSDSVFQIRISAIDDGGNISRGYTAGMLQWHWATPGQPGLLTGSTLPPDGVIAFSSGTASVSGFKLMNTGTVSLIVNDIDFVLHDTLEITVIHNSGMRYGGYTEHRNGFQLLPFPGGVKIVPGIGWRGNFVTLSAYSAVGELIMLCHEFHSPLIFKPCASGVYFFECLTEHGITVKNSLILRN